jgi:hypothetical protein
MGVDEEAAETEFVAMENNEASNVYLLASWNCFDGYGISPLYF